MQPPWYVNAVLMFAGGIVIAAGLAVIGMYISGHYVIAVPHEPIIRFCLRDLVFGNGCR